MAAERVPADREPIPEGPNDGRPQATSGGIFWLKLSVLVAMVIVGGIAKTTAYGKEPWVLPVLWMVVAVLALLQLYDVWLHDRVLVAMGRSRRPTWTRRLLKGDAASAP